MKRRRNRQRSVDERARALAAEIRRVNPTGRGLPLASERQRYDEKTKLQSLAIEELDPLVVAEADPRTPGVVLLTVPHLGIGLCHAVVDHLSHRARSLLESAAASRTGSPVGASASQRQRDERRTLRERYLVLRNRYELDDARALLVAERETASSAEWAELWLDLTVDTLGDLAAAREPAIVPADLTSTNARGALASAHLDGQDYEGALGCLRGHFASAPAAVFERIVDAAVRADDEGTLDALEATLRAELGGVPEAAQRRFRLARESRAAALRSALAERGYDPACEHCRSLAVALARLEPSADDAKRVRDEARRLHLEQHAEEALAAAEALVEAGQFESARASLAALHSRARLTATLRDRARALSDAITAALDEAELAAWRSELAVLEPARACSRLAEARASLRNRLHAELPGLAASHIFACLDVLPPVDALPLALALDALDEEADARTVVVALGPHRSRLARLPAVGARLRAATEEIVSKVASRVAALEAETDATELAALAADLERSIAEAPTAHPDIDASLIAARRALAPVVDALRVLGAPSPAAKLDLARALTGRARERVGPHLRDAWLVERRPTDATRAVAFAHVAGNVLGAFCEDDLLFLLQGGTAPPSRAFRLPAAMHVVRLEARGETVYAFGKDGHVFAFDARSGEPTLWRSLARRVTDARIGANGLVFVQDADGDTLSVVPLVGAGARVYECRRMVWGEGSSFCAYESVDGSVVVLDAGGSIVTRHPSADYRLLGLGEHPTLGAPVFALAHEHSEVSTLSYRAKSFFVTEWLDDAPQDVPIAIHRASDETISVVFEKPGEVEVRRYAPLDFGLVEVARTKLGDVIVLPAGRGKLVSVRIDSALGPIGEPLREGASILG